jgi:SAM-dependent methyltransferase
MDDIAKYNKERWEELAESNVPYSRPWFDLDETSARAKIDPEDILKEIANKDVLCLAGGGGQQSAAFALLGANVTVLDLSERQLQRDRLAVAHYGLQVRTIQGDMRDLSVFDDSSFDIVWHAHSINFVPDTQVVFREVARVLREDGFYHFSCHNPFIHGTWEDGWNGQGYLLHRPYVEGEIIFDDLYWDIDDEDGNNKRVKGPKEFRHTLSTLLNGLIKQGFMILCMTEDTGDDPDAEPGTWQHFMAVAAPWLHFWASYRPGVFEKTTLINREEI